MDGFQMSSYLCFAIVNTMDHVQKASTRHFFEAGLK